MKAALRIILALLVVEIVFFGLFWLNQKFGWLKPPSNLKIATTLVQGFPSVPQVPQTQLVSSTKETVTKNDRYNGVWQSSDSVPNVVAWYINDLPKNEWKVDIIPSNLKATDIQYLTAYKGTLYLQLSIIRKVKFTEITAQITDKSKTNSTK